MTDELNEDKMVKEVYNEYDNSTHSPVNLWPAAIVGIVTAISLLIWLFADQIKDRVPFGRSYVAVGNIVDCTPFSGYDSMGHSYRSYVRTPKNEVFAVYWRGNHQPPLFGRSIGTLKYHECGVQDGNSVHCFDSFTFSGEGAQPLDLDGKPTTIPEPKK